MSTFTSPVLAQTQVVSASSIPHLDFKKTQVTFSDGSVEFFQRPLVLSQLFDHPTFKKSDLLIAVMVNGRVHAKNEILKIGIANVTPVWFDSVEGLSVFRRSLVVITASAAFKVFGSEIGIVFDHHVTNGYKIKKYNEEEFTQEECDNIKSQMTQLIKNDVPLTHEVLSHSEAIHYFKETNRPYSLSLLESINEDKVHCSCCDGFLTLFFRPLLTSTGDIGDHFDLRLSAKKDGLLLIFPLPNKPIPSVSESSEFRLISQSYADSNEVAKQIGIECVGDINKSILNGPTETVLMMENRQDLEISQIAEKISVRVKSGEVKLVSIAGPSASGKTTFSKKLGAQLKLKGITTVVLSTDNYFKNREDSPVDKDGNYDFECLECIRLDALNGDLQKLFRGEAIHPVLFDFVKGKYSYDTTNYLKLPKNGVVVMEGLHGIDENLTAAIPRKQKYFIFIAPMTQLNVDEYNFIGNQVFRFYRRIIRDYLTRNNTASKTFEKWRSVAVGEEKYIFPFVDKADTIWNSAMDYEPSALYTYVLPLLKTVHVDDPNYNLACDLLKTLQFFMPMDDHMVAKTSLLREFIGGSVYE
ncbi:uridine cytidine kinase I, putative [Entamoeba invadens IP1]|uniref:Uridine cytidine kinase I, putative n=1 Tax=Entamoeba invadens IP1 TaxID=370355 RepID=L7FLW4_ENTIV|nr:uridine cytidine kinase I, putative [Entamoeba invadens IP1]ELP84843.1 uridine cytidine kinase I, putative [Entamoeba invadens IP1]|eukprot:XP_004184189.1 uridine cytidine kinase I, putative [Entamoeba invadens IP1]